MKKDYLKDYLTPIHSSIWENKEKFSMLLYMYISNFKGIFVENIWFRIKMKYYINQRGYTYKEKTLQV